MPRPPFTRFPKDKPLPVSQRGELTKAFNSRGSQPSQTIITKIIEQAVLGNGGGSTGGGGGSSGGGGSTGGGGGGVGIVTLAGDVTGSPTANTISAIQGIPIAAQTIASGQAYVLVSGFLVPSNLSGDVAGSLVMNTVVAIQGVDVAPDQPLDGQELVYDASQAAYTPGVNPGAALYLWANCS